MEQAVSRLPAVSDPEVIAPLVEDRIDLLQAHELLQRDHVRALAGRGVDLLLAQHHVLAGAQLIALGDLVVWHRLALLGADPLVPDPSAVLRVHLVEADALVLDCGVDLDRHCRQAEGHRAVPDRARHHLGVTPP